MKEGVEEAPSRIERLIKGELTAEDSAKLAGGAMALTGPVGAVGSTFIGGKTVKNAFGNNSFRPASALGLMADIVHTMQYDHMQRIRAARVDNPFGLKGDTGFAMTVGNYGITRPPGGRSYTGNTRGMDINQLVALEAISKGYDPSNSAGINAFNPKKFDTVQGQGGLFISDNNMDGFFRANGSFYDPRFGRSGAYSTKRQAETAAATAGVSYDEFQNALAQARSGRVTLQQALTNIKAAAAPKPKPKPAPTIPQTVIQAQEQQGDDGDSPAGQPTAYDFSDPADNQAAYEREAFGSPAPSRSAPDPFSDRGRFDGPFAEGGRVGLAMGGAPGMASGFVDRPPEQVPEDQTVADNRPTQLPEGAFVINAAAVEFAGSNDIKDMLLKAHKESIRRGLTVDKQGNGAKLIDVAISSGEVVVAPHLAKIIGYDRLNKINNRGKPETRERIEELGQRPMGAAEGGFIDQPGELGDVGEDVPMQFEIPAESLEKFKKFGVKKQKREDIKTFIRGLSDEEAMALLLLTETSSSVDPLESMEAIGEVVRNRAASNYKDFKKVNNVKDVLLQQTRKGAFQFSGLEPTTLYNRLTEVRSGTATEGLQKTFAAAQNVLSDEPDRASVQRLPYNTLFYTKSAAPSQWMRQSKDLEFSTEIGGHEFYKPFASPEFP